jgi:hypothetical protein
MTGIWYMSGSIREMNEMLGSTFGKVQHTFYKSKQLDREAELF